MCENFSVPNLQSTVRETHLRYYLAVCYRVNHVDFFYMITVHNVSLL